MSELLKDGESTHEYRGRMFVVDYYPPRRVGELAVWQCSDSGHIVRGRGFTKQEAISEAHWRWDDYTKQQNNSLP